MFDLRYHVASLAAVFIALVLGILVGVGLSGRGVLRERERATYQARVSQLERELATAQEQVRRQEALEEYERETYPALIEDRLDGKRIAVVSVGSFEGDLATSVQQTLDDSGATISLRALKVPIATGDLLRAVANLDNAPQTVEELGRALAAELLAGGETPLWEAVGPVLVLERGRGGDIDGVVVVHTAEPQQGQTARFIDGLYARLGASQQAVVGTETTDADPSTIDTYLQHRFTTVDNVDTLTGRLALAVVLETGATGAYGVKEEADVVLPPVEPVRPAAG